MASLDSLTTRSYAKRGVVGYVTDDKPISLRIRSIGGHTVTHVITTGSGSGATALELHDSDGTASIDLTAAATDTLGELCDYINSTTNWECKILDGLRTDSVNTKLLEETVSASTVDGVTYYDLHPDTSIYLAYTYRLTNDRHTDTSGQTPAKGSHRVHIQGINYYANVSAGPNANGVQVWECDGGVETQIMSRASIDATDTPITFASGYGKVTGKDGNDLVVRVVDSTTLTDNTLGYLQVTGELE